MADDALQQIQTFCETNQIRRLQADEIHELLTDGEEPEWVAGQATDERPEVASQLTELLTRLAPDLRRPVPPPEEEEVLETPEEAEPEMSPEEQFAALAQALPPGVDARQVQQMLSTPRGKMLADFGAFCDEKGYADSDEELMRVAHEEWLQTPRDSLEGKKPAELLEGGRLLPEKAETFRREEPKVGRNDPCPCGSGKKYKKCHG
jgi:hypothetical protein